MLVIRILVSPLLMKTGISLQISHLLVEEEKMLQRLWCSKGFCFPSKYYFFLLTLLKKSIKGGKE